MDKVQSLELSQSATQNTFAAPINVIACVFGMLAEAKTLVEPWSRTILDNEGWGFGVGKFPEFTAPHDVWCVILAKQAEVAEGEEPTRNVLVVGGMADESHARTAAGIFQATLDVLRANPQFEAEFDAAWVDSETDDGEGGASGNGPMLDLGRHGQQRQRHRGRQYGGRHQ